MFTVCAGPTPFSFRLVSRRTVEENILKKANQKRLLGDLAIDGGNFTTAQLKTQTVRELFNVAAAEEHDKNVPEERDLQEEEAEPLGDKRSMGVFESAIAAVEDTTDKEVRCKLKNSSSNYRVHSWTSFRQFMRD